MAETRKLSRCAIYWRKADIRCGRQSGAFGAPKASSES